ncbi:hypothetical protein [Tessaracoccus sp.]|uniref:hypothetical protein n=1 Tax=Tessaracoccus sp. TaxID=1971211 RepID=UPI0026261C2E|nr:hypothetical protein [Tessaracoccus sp.]
MIGRIVLGGGIAAAAAAGLGWTIARRLTAPVGPRTFDLTIRSVEHDDNGDLIVLDRTEQTTAHGIYNLWFEHGGWAQLAAEVHDRGPTRIARLITGTASDLAPRAGDRTSWSGIYYATPHEAGLDARNITITTPAGSCPAWRIDGDPSTWAIHIHGLGSTRAGTLRGVLAATELGYTSLVVSHRTPQKGHESAPAEQPSATPRRATLTKLSDTPFDAERSKSCSLAGRWGPPSPSNSPTTPDTKG